MLVLFLLNFLKNYYILFRNSFLGDIFYTVPVSCIIVGCLLLAGFGISAYGVVEEQLIYLGSALDKLIGKI